MILGADVSHFQGAPNFAQVKASGRDFVVLKATEGTGFADASFANSRAAAHAAGLIVGLYHFARAGNATAEADWFLQTVGTLQPGEFLVLDWEVATTDPVAWCAAWLGVVKSSTGVAPFVYMNQSSAAGYNWAPVAAAYGLWLAKYDNSTAQPSVSGWPSVAMKQYSSSGSVPGIAGAVDVDAFYGTTQQLLAYGAGGTQGADMTPEEHLALMQIRDYLGANGGQNSKTPDTVGYKVTQLFGALPQLQAGNDPQAIAKAVIALLPAADAQKVADLVLAGIAAKMNTAG